MISDIINNTLRFFILILIQVLVLNNIHLGGYINPYLYILFILLLPFETPKWLILVLSFLMGTSIDMFSNTMGLHAGACVFMGYCRPYLLKILAPREGYNFESTPGVRSMNLKWFLTYTGILVLLHHLVLFYLEEFSMREFFGTLFRVILSAFFTLLLIIISQYLFFYKTKNQK
jgi:rod shape-determining protein MreD